VNLYMKEVLGVRTLLETDDNYLSMHDASIRGRAGWAQHLGDAHSTTEGHRVIVRDIDGVIVTCEALARTYRKINPNVFVCPNGVDPKDWPEPVKPDDGIFRIGFSGGRSHVGDMKLVLKALEWASAQKDVRVVIQGVGTDGLNFPHERMRWDDDLDAYRTRWQYYDAVVCPIIPNPWSICRSDLKALEGAMGGCALILSDVEPFSAWDDTNCLKASSSKDFLNHVKHLVANRDEVKKLASAAREYVLEKRTTQAQIHLWRDALVED
jgi:glycosyltransferase involved in cell wall biosynthesis